MVAGVRKSLRETTSCFWGVRNLPWTRALGYPRGMTRLCRPEDAPFKGSREKLKRIGGPQGAPWDVVGFVGNVAGAEQVAELGNRVPLRKVPIAKHMISLLK